jgi:flagellar biosynthesis/type III secretory pathway M-ring protein FliF/YscJ
VSWWLWTLIWIALFVGALVVLFLLLRQVWRKLRLLFRDLSTATERLAAVTEELDRLQDRTSTDSEPAAVFERPVELRAQRFAARTKQRGSGRRTPT